LILGGFNHATCKTLALVCGVDGELAKIAARAAYFTVDAGEQRR
jgi:hypothetical protein